MMTQAAAAAASAAAASASTTATMLTQCGDGQTVPLGIFIAIVVGVLASTVGMMWWAATRW